MMSGDLMFGLVELRPTGKDHPLSESSIGAYCQVVAAVSNGEEFREMAEKYFKEYSLDVGEIDGLKHIKDIVDVNADSTLLDNFRDGNPQKHNITIGSFNTFHSEGEA